MAQNQYAQYAGAAPANDGRYAYPTPGPVANSQFGHSSPRSYNDHQFSLSPNDRHSQPQLPSSSSSSNHAQPLNAGTSGSYSNSNSNAQRRPLNASPNRLLHSSGRDSSSVGTAQTTPQSTITSATTARTEVSSSDRDKEMFGYSTPVPTLPAYSKKFVVVGDGGCGKTCLLISYAQGYFPEKYVPTVFENYITTVPHPTQKGKDVELALWDTAGQEEYDRLRPLSYPETDLAFICFAIDSPASLENVLDKWYPETSHFMPHTPTILLGLKSDLRHKPLCVELLKAQGLTPVSTEQGQQVADRIGAGYMECSSKERRNVAEIFERAISEATKGDGRGEGRKGSVVGFRGERGDERGRRRRCRIL